MKSVWTMGEMIVEIMRPRAEMPHSTPDVYMGPYASGAPAIMISSAARMGAKSGIIGGVEDAVDDVGDAVGDLIGGNNGSSNGGMNGGGANDAPVGNNATGNATGANATSFQQMISNARVHDTDGVLTDGENSHW